MAADTHPHRTLTEPLAELLAHRFRALADPTRLRLLEHLRGRDATISELTDALGCSQQNVSKHVGVLEAAGLVSRHREGVCVRCSLADPRVFEMCELVCVSLAGHAAAQVALLSGGETDR